MLRRLARPLAVRVRWFLQAELMDEVIALRKEQAQLKEALNATEALLVTLALRQPEADRL